MTVAMLVAIMVTMIVAIIMAMVVAMVVTTVVAMVVTMVAAMVVAITGVEEEGVIIETRQQAVDIGIGISLPPPIVFVAPPEVIET
jgi:hypothetical protein